MLKVKLNNQFPDWDWLRQTPGHSGIWSGVQFFVNRDDITECDFFFVMGGINKHEEIKCPKENTFFIALENKETQNYDPSFINQFEHVLTHRNDIRHPRIRKTIFPAYWFIGIDPSLNKVVSDRSYNALKAEDVSKSKTKLISVISSNKIITEGHAKRLAFIEVLKKQFGNELDVFGRGINDFKDKWDVLAPYKYHVVLENSCYENEITEKLYDSFLSQCYSFYYGAKNVDIYFDKDSFCKIDLDNHKKSIQIIKSTIANDAYDKSIENIKASKERILDTYNLFNVIVENVIDIGKIESKSQDQKFYPEHFIQNFSQGKYSLRNRFISKASNFLKRVIS
jgi:hypothetical protein